MKISYNWLKDYIPTSLNAEQAGDVLTGTGLEVEGIESYESIPGGLQGVVTGKVVSCVKHPDADRLSLTTVDVGTGELLSIVCGAPNVAVGQKVLVATVGTDLPDGNGGTFTIKKSKIRGSLSEGMICAEDELGLGDNHDGIMVLADDVSVGIPASEYLKIYKDQIIEIGLTPNRPDANGHIGVARDLAAVLSVRNNTETLLRYPDLSDFKEGNEPPPITVEIRDQQRCPRYAGITLNNIQVAPSPKWLSNRLEAIGQRPINNVVDITNYILHEYGQPLHAFDADKIQGNKVIVDTLSTDTEFTTLDEIQRKLHEEDLMICDGNKKGMCIAGVFGGLQSGVTENTQRVFLESAHFNQATIRRTSTRHNLRTDAATCFEKGTDPNICIDALKRAALLLVEYAGATVEGPIVDVYPKPIQAAEVLVSIKYINKLSGLSLPTEEAVRILKALEMDCSIQDDVIHVKVPTNKPDVTRPADIVEEILRIYGLDNIPDRGKFTFATTPAVRPDKNEWRDKISDFLVSRGMLEAMSLSITQSEYFEKLYPIDKGQLIKINNTSNIQLDVLRPDMTISLLDIALFNLNRKQNRLRIFEFGTIYQKINGDYREQQKLGILLSGVETDPSWRNSAQRKTDFYSLKGEVHAVMSRTGLVDYQAKALQSDPRFSFGMRYYRGDSELVCFGKIKPGILKEMGIKQDVYVAEFNWDIWFDAIKKQLIHTTEIPRFPEVHRDLALVLDKQIEFEQIEKLSFRIEKKLLKQVNLFDVYENASQLGESKKSYAITFVLGSNEKTLDEKDIEGCIQRLTTAFEKELKAEIRK
jgi:phenylalanyl-tRNA synthetase beta chain